MSAPASSDLSAARGITAFIGGGNMARSLIGGLIARGASPDSIRVSEPNADARSALASAFGIHVSADNLAAAKDADCIVLAVKPQVLRSVCQEIAPTLPTDALCISIAAGIDSTQIDRWLGGNRAVVRCMPNTPALLGAGATGLFANARTDAAHRQHAEQLLAAVGLTAWIEDESLMDVVTALSGSGPAYVFLLAEAMQAGARALGLPDDTSRALTAQTLLGAARMLSEGNEDAGTLRARVTSPGGTTQAALDALRAGGFEPLMADALAAAARRGAELARLAESQS